MFHLSGCIHQRYDCPYTWYFGLPLAISMFLLVLSNFLSVAHATHHHGQLPLSLHALILFCLVLSQLMSSGRKNRLCFQCLKWQVGIRIWQSKWPKRYLFYEVCSHPSSALELTSHRHSSSNERSFPPSQCTPQHLLFSTPWQLHLHSNSSTACRFISQHGESCSWGRWSSRWCLSNRHRLTSSPRCWSFCSGYRCRSLFYRFCFRPLRCLSLVFRLWSIVRLIVFWDHLTCPWVHGSSPPEIWSGHGLHSPFCRCLLWCLRSFWCWREDCFFWFWHCSI